MPSFRVDPTRTRRRRIPSPSFHHWTPGWWRSEYRHELVACCFNSEWFWDGRYWKEKKSFCIKSSRSYWQNNRVAEQVAGDLILRMTNTQRKNGSKLQGYQFGKTVARGSTAKVKKCIHVATGQTVGIQTLSFKGFPKINHGALEKFKKRVQREIFVAQHLKHSNVMTCYEGKMAKKYAYIVMEWMEGGSLLDYLEERGGTLTEWEARRYFRQLIHGIDYCHKLLLIHRDVKPRNLLLDETKQNLKIADFGVSNYLNDDLKLSTYCGTNFYLAPEIVKDGTLYGGSEADVYSCGVTLYHFLYGCPSSLNFHRGQFCIPDTVKATPDAYDLILRMTKCDPLERITIPEIKGHRWFLEGDQMFLNDPHLDQGIDNAILLETVNTTECEREELIQSLIKGDYTEETTTYKLLKKMRAVEG